MDNLRLIEVKQANSYEEMIILLAEINNDSDWLKIGMPFFRICDSDSMDDRNYNFYCYNEKLNIAIRFTINYAYENASVSIIPVEEIMIDQEFQKKKLK